MTTESNQIDTMNQRSALADFWACFEDAEDVEDVDDAEILRLAVRAAVRCYIPDYLIEWWIDSHSSVSTDAANKIAADLEDRYQGEYESEESFALYMAQELDEDDTGEGWTEYIMTMHYTVENPVSGKVSILVN
jgi:hypothetical protein|tara:strand:+ start:392 stop:793 length:402 start_codon:yes stop_codon:yes gene_type:complete